VPRHGYRFGVPEPGHYAEIFNTDAEIFGGSNLGNPWGADAEEINAHGRPYSISVTLPPLSVVAFKKKR